MKASEAVGTRVRAKDDGEEGCISKVEYGIDKYPVLVTFDESPPWWCDWSELERVEDER
jgi:hypothetical protein